MGEKERCSPRTFFVFQEWGTENVKTLQQVACYKAGDWTCGSSERGEDLQLPTCFLSLNGLLEWGAGLKK